MFRNLIARRGSTVPAALAMIGSVAAITAMLSLLEGLYAALYESGHPGTVVVMARGATDELTSALPLAKVSDIEVAPGLVRAEGRAVVSPEVVVSYRFRDEERGFDAVTIRGVDPAAFQVHPGTKITGTFPASGQPGVVIGVKRKGALSGFDVGGKVHIGRSEWPVTGILEAPGTVFESEIWTDRQALMTELNRKETLSVAYAKVENESVLGALSDALGRDQKTQVKVVSERELYRQSYSTVELFARSILIMTVVLALGASFAAVNAMYTAFLGRLPELATLRAIGYTRRRVAAMLVQENLLLAIVCGGIGLALASLMHGRTMSYEATALVYSAQVTPRVLAGGFIATLAIGGISGLVALVHAWRLEVLDALRSL